MAKALYFCPTHGKKTFEFRHGGVVCSRCGRFMTVHLTQ